MESRRMKRLLSAACHYSYTRLALNYYMYYETSLEHFLSDNRLVTLSAAYNRLLKGFLEDGCDIGALDELRNQVTAVMETSTAYTDAFQAYEYVLNRLEGRFGPQLLEDSGISGEDAMTVRIMSYIMDEDDPMTVNERIRSVLGQLPVRLTKQKFFAFVEEGLSAYRGGTRESLDDMLYILRSEALLNQPEDMVTGYEELHSILEKFKTSDYRDMKPEHYRYLTSEMERAGRILMDKTSQMMLLTELVNDLYVLFLARDTVMMEVSEEQRLKGILEKILALFEAGKGDEIPQELTDSLEKLEGKQEAYFEQWISGLGTEEPKAGKVHHKPHDASEIQGQEDDADKLYKVELLLSGSSFMSLRGHKPGGEALVDDIMLKQALEQFQNEFSQAFDGQPKALVRAVMAKVLSCLPVFFESLEEAQEYIKNSLESCTDYMEKAITMKLIEELMNEDGFGWDRG